jgi:hypothetical protein
MGSPLIGCTSAVRKILICCMYAVCNIFVCCHAVRCMIIWCLQYAIYHLLQCSTQNIYLVHAVRKHSSVACGTQHIHLLQCTERNIFTWCSVQCAVQNSLLAVGSNFMCCMRYAPYAFAVNARYAMHLLGAYRTK